ncbi:hypothetical protein INE80_04654 [Bacteroides ovatus]|nr:hypothetical protein INE80_04654 [Bacteroides ovatus]
MMGSREPRSGNNSLVPAFFYAPGFLFGTKETTRKHFLTMDTFFSNTHPRSMASYGNANMQPFASLLIIKALTHDAAFCSLPKIKKAAFCSLSFSVKKFEKENLSM